MEPQLLLLDEPSSGLNVEETEDLSFWMSDIKEDLGITIILVEHNMRFVCTAGFGYGAGPGFRRSDHPGTPQGRPKPHRK